MRGGADARLQQEFGRTHGAGRDDDLAVGADGLGADLDADGAFAFEQDASDVGAGAHGEIFPRPNAVVPALAAVFAGPGVVVGGVTAGVDLRVDGGAATDHLGLGVAQHAVVHVLLRHGLPAPTGDAFGHLGEARRHVEQRAAVAATG